MPNKYKINFKAYFELMRLHQLTGVYLLLFPVLWSLILATGDLKYFSVGLLIIFVLGALIMRAAGCIINDFIDRKIDAKVERTKNRPLANNTIKPISALILLALLLFLALSLLLLLNKPAIIIGFLSIIPIIIYPFMKRITNWAQAFLGLVFNLGVLIAWVSIRGEVELEPILLYLAAFFWTLGYDTIYAHQDKEFDSLIGLKSTALALKENTKKYLFIFYGLANILLWFTGIIAGLNIYFYIILVLSLFQLLWQIITLDINNPEDCLIKFKSNRYYGLVILFAYCLGLN